MRKNQFFLEDKSKLKTALSGLEQCLLLLPCNKKEVGSCEWVWYFQIFNATFLWSKDTALLLSSVCKLCAHDLFSCMVASLHSMELLKLMLPCFVAISVADCYPHHC